MNYTKGEWKHQRTSDGQLIYVDPTDSNEDAEIALVYDIMSDEDTANAHLIAAAPDMYEALKGYGQVYAEALRTVEPEYRIMVSDFFTKIAHALAKAEGK